MGRRSRHGTLADRTAQSRGDGGTAPAPPPVRHCWVTGPHGRLPGLLLSWARRSDGWHGRVVHPVRKPDGWIVVEEWLPAHRLEPADSQSR